MNECIFCRIACHESISFIVHEDDDVLAFMDRNPINKGHVLIIPKDHIENMEDVEESLHAKVFTLGKKIAIILRKVYSPKKVAYAVEGLDIPHAHLHIFPIHQYHDLTSIKLLNNEIKSASDEDLQRELDRIKHQMNDIDGS